MSKYICRLKQCKLKGWSKYGYGALDLMHLPSSDKVLHRTNVSGTSPKFEYCKFLGADKPLHVCYTVEFCSAFLVSYLNHNFLFKTNTVRYFLFLFKRLSMRKESSQTFVLHFIALHIITLFVSSLSFCYSCPFSCEVISGFEIELRYS